ncbi:hypothetical protein ACFYTQ_36770 [Nocardia sp. NPDC004068]|uniref:hypothetical protein n=1 Tax=Nocardia sp. NPDC004068 TaxID=3364303 RepID=UPI0036835A7A
MLFVPESVLGMARAIEPATEAMREHAALISEVGFDPAHTGQDYLEQGTRLAAVVDGIVTMLHSWSDASNATVDVFRQAVSMTTATEERNRGQLQEPVGGAGTQ